MCKQDFIQLVWYQKHMHAVRTAARFAGIDVHTALEWLYPVSRHGAMTRAGGHSLDRVA